MFKPFFILEHHLCVYLKAFFHLHTDKEHLRDGKKQGLVLKLLSCSQKTKWRATVENT